MKKKYRTPKAVDMPNEIHNGVPMAIWAAVLLIARAVAAAVKGHIDVKAGADAPKTLQIRR